MTGRNTLAQYKERHILYVHMRAIVKAGECGPRCKRGSEAEKTNSACKVFNPIGNRRTYPKWLT